MASPKEEDDVGEEAPPAPERPPGSEAARRAQAASRLIDQLAGSGIAIVDDFVAPALVVALRDRARELVAEGAMRPAKIGRGANERRAADVRGDFISWLEEPHRDAEHQLLDALERTRHALNRELMAGLVDFEGHFARYPAGAAYARHSDRPKGSDVRAISIVLYLNDAWSTDDGGALRIYGDEGESTDVLPAGGRLVAFDAERFEHEVLPARRERLSFTGWFRRRPLDEVA